METFGDIIKTERESKSLLLRQVASALEIDQAIISKFERGERKPTKERTKKKIHSYTREKRSKIITLFKKKF